MARTLILISFGHSASNKGNYKNEVRKSHAILLRKAVDFNPCPVDVLAKIGNVFSLEIVFKLDPKLTALERKNILVKLFDNQIEGIFDHKIDTYEIVERK